MTTPSQSTGLSQEPGRRRNQALPDGPRVYRQLNELKEGVSSAIDPLGMAAPIAHAQLTWLLHPQELSERLALLSSDLWRLQWHSWQRMLGLPTEDPITPNADDVRFSDPAWSDSPALDLIKEWYLAFTRHTQDMLYDTPGLSGKESRRAAFWWRNWLNAVAPTNYLWTNPVAIRKAMETRGDSLARGFQNFLDDLRAGNVRMTDPEDFEVGRNLATTPGSVVFRNRLLEVIHYAPVRPQVHAEPVVIITPWINKFYVLDLTPKKSMIRFLLDQGLDVFITSWKNPGAAMSEVCFDDYLIEGIDTTVQIARQLSGAKQVHAIGYCIGGTALAMYMAWANRRYGADAAPIADGTFLTTLVDFHKPGDIDVFIDKASVHYLCSQMQRNGYLDGGEMASAFRFLRSNSLIWHYVVHGWLYGETPPPFDVLYWNMDTTRMPQAMHSWYLTELYLHNRLTQPGALTVAGEALDLAAIHQPLYA
ncbi:MAG: alpha/beta hydrolase, partial [Pseudogulbenkiania sp.]|nr:alpha/beta hydrolase [Pseudogulbenkiania sp.]